MTNTNYNSDEEIMKKGRLHLERLLLNFLGNEVIMVVNDENGLVATGTESEIMQTKPLWLLLIVSKISYNEEAGMIQVNIMEE